jgi:hypothetical protein
MSGSATDLVSNEVLIQALRTSNGVGGLLRNELPASTYRAFAHEATHHWCFVSPIGATVTLLRARSDVALYKARTAQDVEIAVSGRIVADALATAFRPIGEGIALFAELNMRTSPTGLYIDPCGWVTRHLIRHELSPDEIAVAESAREDPELVPDEVHQRFVSLNNAFLDDVRLSADQIDARRKLSMRGLDCADGSYLSGGSPSARTR